MADPAWTSVYDMNTTPEGNGFTRVLYNDPVVNIITSGSINQRRVEIESDAGDCVFQISSVPALTLASGATIETLVAVSGSGDAGIELTLQDGFVSVMVYSDRIVLVVDGLEGEEVIDSQANSGDILIRLTIDTDAMLRVYRNGVLIDSRTMPQYISPLPRVLFWGESGGTQIFRSLKFYTGGAVAP